MFFNSLKKSLLTLSLVAATTMTPIQKSHAIVGVCSWNPPLIGAGFLVFSSALIPASLGAGAIGLGTQAHPIIKYPAYAVGGLLVGVGIVMSFVGFTALPDGSMSMEYSPIQPKDLDVLQITQEEARTFNSELDQVNLLIQQVTSELNQIENPTVEQTADTFAKYDGVLSAGTIKVMQQISLKMLEN